MPKHLWQREDDTPLDNEITRVLAAMADDDLDSEEYPKKMRYLEQLSDIKAKKSQDPVSKDTIALVVGNLLGILVIVAYEQKHVARSIGFSHLVKPKTSK